jgi:hypothetical protein
MSKNHQMSVMERIDFMRANSVTDEEFQKTWNYSINDFSKKMSKRMKKWDEQLEYRQPAELKKEGSY